MASDDYNSHDPFYGAHNRWPHTQGYNSAGSHHNTPPLKDYQSEDLSPPPSTSMPVDLPYHMVRPSIYRPHHQMPPFAFQPMYPIWPSMLTGGHGYHGYQTPILPAVPVQTPMFTVSTASKETPTSAMSPKSSSSRRKLTEEERREICMEASTNPNMKQTQIGLKFGVERSTISKILRQKSKYMNSEPKEESSSPTNKSKIKLPDIERVLMNWVRNEERRGKTVSYDKLKKQALCLSSNLANSNTHRYLTSDTWLASFRQKNRLETDKKSKSSSKGLSQITIVDSSAALCTDSYLDQSAASSDSELVSSPLTDSSSVHASVYSRQRGRKLPHFQSEESANVRPNSSGPHKSLPVQPMTTSVAPQDLRVSPRERMKHSELVPNIREASPICMASTTPGSDEEFFTLGGSQQDVRSDICDCSDAANPLQQDYTRGSHQTLARKQRRTVSDEGYFTLGGSQQDTRLAISDRSRSVERNSSNTQAASRSVPGFQMFRAHSQGQAAGNSANNESTNQKFLPATSDTSSDVVSSRSAISHINSTTPETEEFSDSSANPTTDSEGENSFVYGANNSDHYWSTRAEEYPSLSKHLAGLTLRAFVETHFRGRPAQRGSSSSTSRSQNARHPSDSSSSAFLAASSTSSFSSVKRSLDAQDGSRDSGEDEDGKIPKRPCHLSSDRAMGNRLLACPYYRFDLNRYSERNTDEMYYRGCASVCLRDISRLKQHLYRVHCRPEYYCGGCYSVFKAQADFDAHARQRPRCDNAEPQFQEKMDKDQMNRIKRRKVLSLPHIEWLDIYRILFPESDPPPFYHSYADGDSSEILQQFWASFEAEAPTMFSSLVRTHLHARRISLGEETRNILDAAFEHASSRLVELLRPRFDEARIQRPVAQQLDDQGQATRFSEADSATQELPVLEDTSDFSDLDLFVAPEEWFNLEYMDRT